MPGSKKMMLRVQSSEGTARVEVLDTDVTSRLFERVYESLHMNTFGFALFKDRAKKEEIASSKSIQLLEYGLQHGDMIYLTPVNGAVLFDQPSTSVEINSKSHKEPSITDEASEAPVLPSIDINNLEEDEVDIELYGLSGKIERQRDEKLCNHNANGRCVHCSPLEPWDEDYLKEHNIKHMSFHAYLRKMTTGKFVTLEELSFKIKPGCKEHPPWPRGICSACQPGAVTLNRQRYRHVDNVLVEHAAPVDRFLAYWRATGHQRAAYLLGRYERHTDVPLGVRARVAALYEPPQECARDRLRLLPDARARLVDALAARLGLRRVGWLFTDLLAAEGEGQVQCLRGAHSHFLSAQECITAGALQNAHPRACRAAAAGALGSKWVTVVATGDAARRVHLEGYQVSGQCQALVRDGVLLPTRDAPDLAYIRDSSQQQFVPDVYYKERDAYGNEVNVSAKRLPVAYLLVDVPCGVAPDSTQPTFEPTAAFPPAHRALPQHVQSLRALHRHVQRHTRFLDAVSDFHVLLYLATNEALPLSLEQLAPLLDAVRARDSSAAAAWCATPHAATLLRLARAADEAEPAPPAGAPIPGAPGAPAGAPALWTCPLCTFHNAAALDACEMCAMPRNAM